jgi:predicted dehydrogenase
VSRLKVGVIGAGAIAQVAHLPVLRKLPDVEITAICDNDLPKAQALASRFEIKNAFDDIEDVLQYGGVDAVAICTPNHLHETHVAVALQAGAHVLCERPLAMNSAGVERTLKVAERYGKRVMVGMNHRFRSDVQAVRSFVTNGELGALESVRCGWYTFRPARQHLGWRLARAESGGGVMFDMGLALVDLGLWLSGNPAPKRVSAAFAKPTGSDVEDAGCALITCESGLTLFVDTSWHHIGHGEKFWFDMFGTKGAAHINPLRVFKELHGNPTDVTPTGGALSEHAFTTSYRAEWSYFLATARGDVQAPPSRDQLMLHRVMEAIYQSADQGRDITL